MTHLTTDDAARWVAGLLEPAQAEALEAHARGCPPCEALLQAEARMEVKLGQALHGAGPASVIRLRTPVRWALLAAPLALAAALALTFREGPLEQSVGTADAGVRLELPDPTHFEGEKLPPEALEARSVFEL